MRRPRITVSGLMCVVFIFAIAFHLSVGAVRVHSAKEYHAHTWVLIQGGKPFIHIASAERPPFWPRYWRYLIGLPWKGLPLCSQVQGRFLDMCGVLHPEILKRDANGNYQIHQTQSQTDLFWKLKKQKP